MEIDVTAAAVRRQNFHHAKVLLVEGDPDQMAVIVTHMAVCLPEVEPVQARSEEEALTYLTACLTNESGLPKMILLSSYIPHRNDGWRILEAIKNLPAPGNQIPVVLLSHSAEADDIREAYERGVSSYLMKPANPDEWLAYFQMLRAYWWETVSLPQADYRL